MPDLPSRIGRYHVTRRLAKGGMGVLYLARDPAIDRTVVLKVARVDNAELREIFLREARATGRLQHPNIVTVFDVGEHDGEPFIAMEYVPGQTLAEIVSGDARLPLASRLRMLRELCDGLAYAHSQGIVHRDIKPANLIARGDSGVLTILDFGIARLGDATTIGAGMIGTPHYMAPEQVEGRHVDHRCDIFAVGLVFYELLSCRRAFDGDSPTSVLYRIVHDEPVPLASLVPDLDPGLVRIVDRAVQKRAADRYQQLSDLIADLDACIARAGQSGRAAESPIPRERTDEPGPGPGPSYGSGVGRTGERAHSDAQPAAAFTPGTAGPRKRLKLAAALGGAAVIAATLVSGGMWLASSGSDRQESSPAGAVTGTRGPEPGGGVDPGAGPAGSVAQDRPLTPGTGGPAPAEEGRASRPEAPVDEVAAAAPPPVPNAPARVREPVRPAPTPEPEAPPPPPRSPPPAPPAEPDVDGLLADAVAAETAGDAAAALVLYASVLRRQADNRTALSGRERVQAALDESAARERTLAANAAFAAGRYDDARRLYRDAFERTGSPEAADGLRRVDDAEALICDDDATCGTLVVRVEPAASIFIDDRAMGAAAELRLRLRAGRHRVRLETEQWRFPWALELAPGATAELEVDLERDGFPR